MTFTPLSAYKDDVTASLDMQSQISGPACAVPRVRSSRDTKFHYLTYSEKKDLTPLGGGMMDVPPGEGYHYHGSWTSVHEPIKSPILLRDGTPFNALCSRFSYMSDFVQRGLPPTPIQVVEWENKRLKRFWTRTVPLARKKFQARQKQKREAFERERARRKALLTEKADRIRERVGKLLSLPVTEKRLAKLRLLQSRYIAVLGRIASLKHFIPKMFKPPQYVPKYYNHLTGQPLVATRLPGDALIPNEVLHHKVRATAPSVVTKGVYYRGPNYYDDEAVCEISNSRSEPLAMDFPPPAFSKYYDSEKLYSAIKKIAKQAIQEPQFNSPVFAAEFGDTINFVQDTAKTMKDVLDKIQSIRQSVVKLIRARGLRRLPHAYRIFRDGWGIFSTAWLYKKFSHDTTASDLCDLISSLLDLLGPMREKAKKLYEKLNKTYSWSRGFDRAVGQDFFIPGTTVVTPEKSVENKVDAWYQSWQGSRLPMESWPTGYPLEPLWQYGDSLKMVSGVHTSVKTWRVTVFGQLQLRDMLGNVVPLDDFVKGYLLNMFGLYLSLDALWEIIPLSWLVDYFCNIAEVLNSRFAVKWFEPKLSVQHVLVSCRTKERWEVPRLSDEVVRDSIAAIPYWGQCQYRKYITCTGSSIMRETYQRFLVDVDEDVIRKTDFEWKVPSNNQLLTVLTILPLP